MIKQVPVNQPLLDGNEKKYLNECIDTGWISSEGPFVARFEKEFAAYVDRQYAVAVCNGSVAIDAAIAALEIGPGDEVILPTFTIVSCATSIVRAGAVPVVVDSDPSTWNIAVDAIESKITPKTKAIMVVHIYGLPVDMDPILALCKKHSLYLIEDAAEAHGQTYKGRKCGSFGDVSTFSFYPNKLVTTGEGGMVVMNSPEIAKRCQSLRNLCFIPSQRFYHEELGWNFRMTNIQAALGVAQLERAQSFAEKKRAMGKLYQELLQPLNQYLELPLAATSYAENIYWVFGLVLKDSVPFDAAEVMKKLGSLGVGTRPFFWPMHEQPVFKKLGLFAQESCPVAERIARRGFYIPSGLAITKEEIEFVVTQLKRVFG